MPYFPRAIEEVIHSLISKYPILAVTGPRQSGKTTLLKNMLPGYRYVSLENTDNRYFAERDPNGFLAR
jgi:predicted AAA+ superfamily ATPase